MTHRITVASRFRGRWGPQISERLLAPRATAMLLCDIWDDHWCPDAAEGIGEIAAKVAPLVTLARDAGFQIIHAPSETMAYYDGTPGRLMMRALPRIAPAIEVKTSAARLPAFVRNGDCSNPRARRQRAWTRQHPAIEIRPGDGITDDGEEVYSLLSSRGINTLVMAGVHANRCVLNRSFGLRKMTSWGVDCIFARDLTDVMCGPDANPREALDTVIEHIERFWCPTILGADLVGALTSSLRGIP